MERLYNDEPPQFPASFLASNLAEMFDFAKKSNLTN